MLRTSVSTALLILFALPASAVAQEASKVRAAADKAWSDQDWTAAAAAYEKVVATAPDDAVAWHHLGYALHALKKWAPALKAHKRAADIANPGIQPIALYNVACVYAIQKEKDEAFAWLNKAVAAGFTNAEQFDGDPDMDNLRDDPRFKKLLARAAEASSGSLRVFNYSAPRQSSRATYIGKQSSPGQLAVDYGIAKWQSKYEGVLANEKYMNRRWRLGANFWTTLDTNIPLTLSGVEIPAGYYYLTLENKGEGKVLLNVLEPAAVRKYRIDPYAAHLTKGGIDVPLKVATSDEVAEQLSIQIKVDSEDKQKGQLAIRFGPHMLTAPMKIHLVR